MKMVNHVLSHYGLDAKECKISSFGTGLINHTWLVEKGATKYILQKVNSAVFKNPLLIADNLEKIENYIKTIDEDYFFVSPLRTVTGTTMISPDGDTYYRIFEFVPNSHTLDVVLSPEIAFEAAKQFGKFTKVLSGIDVASINITLPHFHDLSLRYNQFLDALKNGNPDRIRESTSLINTLRQHSDIVEEYNRIVLNPAFKLRVTHHDTKISNVLFDDQGKGICVIDLDTVMPGYFISDVGDMMRTYLCPVSEEESDFNKIEIRDEYYEAILDGYNYYMGEELSMVEKKHLLYSGKFMIYMQALRFLTDFLNNDIYYGAHYEEHNYIRAKNQSILLSKLIEKESVFI